MASKSQPSWTAKDVKINQWLLSQDQVQGIARRASSKDELAVWLWYSLLKPQ